MSRHNSKYVIPSLSMVTPSHAYPKNELIDLDFWCFAKLQRESAFTPLRFAFVL